MVTWTSRSDGADMIKAVIYDGNGALVMEGDPDEDGIRTLIESFVDLGKLTVSHFADGGFALAYAQTNVRVSARTFDSLGLPTGDVVSVTPSGVSLNHAEPSIAVMKDGRFLVGFTHARGGINRFLYVDSRSAGGADLLRHD